MGRRTVTALAAVCVLAAVLAVASCARTTVKTTSDKGGGGRPAGLGDTIALKTVDTTWKVTPLKVKYFRTIKVGHKVIARRLTGVMLEIQNAGRKPISDTPSIGALLITVDGQELDAFSGLTGPHIMGEVWIAPGDERRGWICFKASKGSADRFRFTPDSGVADQSGEWLLK
jgi:hypothetical protein